MNPISKWQQKDIAISEDARKVFGKTWQWLITKYLIENRSFLRLKQVIDKKKKNQTLQLVTAYSVNQFFLTCQEHKQLILTLLFNIKLEMFACRIR